MRYDRISADCHIDMPWIPSDLFTANASAALRERMPYVVDGPDGKDVHVSALSSAKFSPQAKARKFAEAILRRTIRNGEEVVPAALYDEPCQILVTVEPLADGGSRNTIERVLPAKGALTDDDGPF